MSFKSFSTSQSGSGKHKPDDKAKKAPAGGEPTAQAAKKPDDVTAAGKS